MNLTRFLLLFFPVLYSSVSSYAYTGPLKIHSGRIPSKVKLFIGKKRRPLDDKSVQQLLAESLPANDLKPEHKLLYFRALQKDYDFAQFGQPCQILSLDDLEAFLRILGESIEPQEGQHETTSPSEKGDILESLFNTSRAICDFRNLLTCHKHFRTCACAHPSMGLNRDGICGINIGHPCDLSERVLLKFKIHLTPETNPVKCLLENAECTLDKGNDRVGGSISPIRKVCQCRDGFWGATCRRRHGPGQFMKVPHGVSNPDPEKESEVVRSFWIDEGGGALGEYFLHPEEIKVKLVEMMNVKAMYPPEYREDEAQKLVQHLESDVDKEEMVVHELHLRQLARLNLGQVCQPERQVILDNPPVAKDGERWIDPPPDDIKSWQLGLLQDKKPFCNIYQHLRCDETTRVCQCKPGLVMESGSCVIPLGYNCGQDYDTILEFDPLRDRKRFSEAFPPECGQKLVCRDQPLFFQKKCWCKEEKNCSSLFDEGKFKSMVSGVQSRFILGQGDSCDPKMHQRLLSYKNENEDPSHKERMSLIRELIENPEYRLCDIGSHLNCSEISRTCECWKQLKRNRDGECVSINMASCGRTFEYGKYLYHEGSQLWQVEKTFQTQFLPDCIPNASCAGADDMEWAGRCVCRNSHQTGEDCSDPRSALATAFKASHIPNSNDDQEMAMIRVFFDVNKQTYLLEQLMTLTVDQVCDPSTGLKLERIVKFWKEVASSDDTKLERRSLSHFVAVTKWTKYLVSTAGNTAALCNATEGLRCHQPTEKCACPRGSRWIEDKCYLDLNEACDPKPGGRWVPTCANGTKCTKVGRNYGTYQCTECTSPTCHQIDRDEDDYENEFPWEETETEDEEATAVVIGRTVQNGRSMGGFGRSAPSHKEDNLPPVSNDGAAAPEEELTKHQKAKYLEEIDRMLQEIITYRILHFGVKCDKDEEASLAEIFPRLPVIDMDRLAKPIPHIYTTLNRVYWSGKSICNRKEYLSCGTHGVCGCSIGFGLIEEGGECRLLESRYCTSTAKVNRVPLKRAFPELKCQRGTTCMRLDYGMAVCTKSEFVEEDMPPMGRSLLVGDKRDGGAVVSRHSAHILYCALGAILIYNLYLN